MRQFEKHSANRQSQAGAILIIILLFLFIMTVMMLNDSDDVIVNHKISASFHHHFSVFLRAEFGWQKMIFALQNRTLVIPSSPIALQTTAKLLKIDSCGNQTFLITVIASDDRDVLMLKSRDIFATVPKEKKCKKIPRHQTIWFLQE